MRLQSFVPAGLALITVTLLSACLNTGRPAPVPPTNLPGNSFGAFRAAQEPPFGNTATNLRRITQQPPKDGVVRFVVLGDNRNSTPITTGGNKVYRKVIDKINEINPDFAVNLGDFTFDALRPNWNKFEEITSRSQVPYLTVVGNHDILFGRAYYETRYTPPNPETGLDDYAFDYGGARFIMMDSANYNFTERQFQWMERQLQTPLKKMIFSHTPPRFGVWQHKLAPSPEVTRRWMEMNKRYNVDHVFLGHVHLYDNREVDGIDYTISGGGGAPLDNKHYGQGVYHVVLAEVHPDGIRTQMVPIQTNIRTQGPTTNTHGLDAHEMQNPNVLRGFPTDYIPPEEQGDD